MVSERVQDAINRQINSELVGSYNYLAMAAHCELNSFRGCAHWLRVQSQEEYGHAMKLFDFLLARNGKVQLLALPEPATSYPTVVDVFQQALAQEEEVSRQIDSLYELAFGEKAFAALVELQWFITEQVEEEKTARDIFSKFQLLKNDPAALLDLDRELGARVAEATPPTASAE